MRMSIRTTSTAASTIQSRRLRPALGPSTIAPGSSIRCQRENSNPAVALSGITTEERTPVPVPDPLPK